MTQRAMTQAEIDRRDAAFALWYRTICLGRGKGRLSEVSLAKEAWDAAWNKCRDYQTAASSCEAVSGGM